ncbi:MAG TPA: SulP family inorganic anion transporter [Bdellovibrionales bacterium]|nr:SulP family inorganic anion transporter [Bdellovibrionales bacterium]
MKRLVPDFTASLTGAIATIPDAMASAVIAGVSPMHGLYAAMIGTPVAALFASSALVTVTSTSALSLLTKSGLAGIPDDKVVQGLIILTLLTGLIQLLLGFMKLGFLTYFVSNSVMTGFLTGVSVLILLGTIPSLLGFHSEQTRNVLKFFDLVSHPEAVNYRVASVAVLSITLYFLFSKMKIGRVDLSKIASILVIVLVTTIVAMLPWFDVKTLGETLGGEGLLPKFEVPDFSLVASLVGPAIAIASIGLIQGAGVSQATPNPDGSLPSLSRDFLSQGAGNVASGMIQGLPVGGSLSATAMMKGAGIQSRWGNVFLGIVLFLILLACKPLLSFIPETVIDSLLFIFVAYSLRPKRVKVVWNTGLVARLTMLFSFITTLWLPLQVAVGLSIILSFLIFVFRSSDQVHVVEVETNPEGFMQERKAPKDLPSHATTILIPYGSLFFAGARVFEQKLPSADGAVDASAILSLRGRREVGSTFIEAAARYSEKLRRNGGRLILTGVSREILSQLSRTRTLDVIGSGNVFLESPNIGEGIKKAYQRAKRLHEANAPS